MQSSSVPKETPIRIVVSDGRLEVFDHGAGIDESELSEIFDRFYRSANARSCRVRTWPCDRERRGGALRRRVFASNVDGTGRSSALFCPPNDRARDNDRGCELSQPTKRWLTRALQVESSGARPVEQGSSDDALFVRTRLNGSVHGRSAQALVAELAVHCLAHTLEHARRGQVSHKCTPADGVVLKLSTPVFELNAKGLSTVLKSARDGMAVPGGHGTP